MSTLAACLLATLHHSIPPQIPVWGESYRSIGHTDQTIEAAHRLINRMCCRLVVSLQLDTGNELEDYTLLRLLKHETV